MALTTPMLTLGVAAIELSVTRRQNPKRERGGRDSKLSLCPKFCMKRFGFARHNQWNKAYTKCELDAGWQNTASHRLRHATRIFVDTTLAVEYKARVHGTS
jgi:hypothetical protein